MVVKLFGCSLQSEILEKLDRLRQTPHGAVSRSKYIASLIEKLPNKSDVMYTDSDSLKTEDEIACTSENTSHTSYASYASYRNTDLSKYGLMVVYRGSQFLTQLQLQHLNGKKEFPPKCYRCDLSKFETKEEYENHCVTRHPGVPAYPGPADLKDQELIPQGMSWEI